MRLAGLRFGVTCITTMRAAMSAVSAIRSQRAGERRWSSYSSFTTESEAVSRTLIIGDVHSCAAELQHLLQQTQPTRVILVGDVFNKGPDPDGTWDLIQEWGAESVLGNHDLRVRKLAKRGELRAPEAAIAWLKTLPLTIEGDGWVVVHGGLNPEGKTTRDPGRAPSTMARRRQPGQPSGGSATRATSS